jgi:hypothetical protein
MQYLLVGVVVVAFRGIQPKVGRCRAIWHSLYGVGLTGCYVPSTDSTGSDVLDLVLVVVQSSNRSDSFPVTEDRLRPNVGVVCTGAQEQAHDWLHDARNN